MLIGSILDICMVDQVELLQQPLETFVVHTPQVLQQALTPIDHLLQPVPVADVMALLSVMFL